MALNILKGLLINKKTKNNEEKLMAKSTSKEFKWFVHSQPLSEIYQSVEMKFSMAGEDKDGNVLQCHPWVKCRDFLHDAIRSQVTGVASSIYGFRFDPSQDIFPEISIGKTMLLVSQQTIKDVKKYREHLSRALKFINYYENLAGVANATLKKVPMKYCEGLTSYKHVWLFEGDTFWISAPYMISMLTMLLRLGAKLPKKTVVDAPEEVYKNIIEKHESMWKESKENGKTPKKDNDIVYMQTCYDKLSKLVTLKGELAKIHGEGVLSAMYDPKVGIGDFHNTTGILSACKGITWNNDFNAIIKGAFK